MLGNPIYGNYIPDRIRPMSLNRDFLLTVSEFNYIIKQLIAFIDQNLYKDLYAISKIELGKRNANKWKDYNIQIESSVLEKLKNFVPIEG